MALSMARALALVGVLGWWASAPAPALIPARSDAATRARVVELATRLERDPLGPRSGALRRELDEILAGAPDLTTAACPALMRALDPVGDPALEPVLAMYRIGVARFIVESEEWAREDVGVELAGLTSVLGAYRALLRDDPRRASGILDRLVALEDEGRLAGWLRARLAACGVAPR